MSSWLVCLPAKCNTHTEYETASRVNKNSGERRPAAFNRPHLHVYLARICFAAIPGCRPGRALIIAGSQQTGRHVLAAPVRSISQRGRQRLTAAATRQPPRATGHRIRAAPTCSLRSVAPTRSHSKAAITPFGPRSAPTPPASICGAPGSPKRQACGLKLVPEDHDALQKQLEPVARIQRPQKGAGPIVVPAVHAAARILLPDGDA